MEILVEELIKKLDKHLECSICHEHFTHPVTLTCGHSYCIVCIRKHLEKSRDCPECRGHIPKGIKLKKSVALCDIVKVVSDHKSFVSNEETTTSEEVNSPCYVEDVILPQESGDITATSTSHHPDNHACEKEQDEAPHVDAACASAEVTGGVYLPLDKDDLGERVSQELAISQPPQNTQKAQDFAPPLPGAIFTSLTFTPALGHRRLDFRVKSRVVTKGAPGYHTDRFDISQWLAEQQFSEGVHYWDVDTSRSMGWAIGVAYDSIGRGDQLGRTPSSWCLECCRERLSYWHKDTEEPLKHGNPSMVRVAMDVTGGSLSFYSLTDSQILLYSVQEGFSQPVRPAFWLYGLKPQNALSFPQASDRQW